MHRIEVESGGRPLRGATLRVYLEDPAKTTAQFTDSDLAPIFSDWEMTQAIGQTTDPLVTDQFGGAEAFLPSGTQIAVKVTRAGYGERWIRYIDVLGFDPA